ncbi:MAG TPA: FMN-binding protein [Tepidisphaeraceae bacterium]|nr:FMN-binding protein [Tepidisphaeraceae bacterium]
MRKLWMVSVGVVVGGVLLAAGWAAQMGEKPSLKEAMAGLKVPPAWFDTTTISWDTNRPWQEARLEIRRLLAMDEAHVRQGVKLTWLYAQKGDIGNGHELPMYLFMSGNYAWAIREYPEYLRTVTEQGPTHAYLCYASCLAHFGEYDQALALLDRAIKDLPPKPWAIASAANVHNAYGDLYVQMGQIEKAKQHYAEAIRLYPTSDQPYGRHLLHRYAAKVQTKLDLLTMQSLAAAKLRDGVYRGTSLGYGDTNMEVTVTIAGGKIADMQLKHKEKIELGATKIIPRQIIARQSLKVDAVTGATVTSQAIVDGAFDALKKAGLK